MLCDQILTPGPTGPLTVSANLEFCMRNDPGPDGQGVFTLQGDLRVEGAARLRVFPGVTLRADGNAKLDVNPNADPNPQLQIEGALLQTPVVVGPHTQGFIQNSDIDGGSIEVQDQSQVALGGNRFFGELPLRVPVQAVDPIMGNGNLFSGEVQIGLADSAITANQSLRTHNGLPYCVTGTVSIQNGATLRVDPGTELRGCGGSIEVGGPGTGGGDLDMTAAVIDGPPIRYHEFSNGRIGDTNFVSGTLTLDQRAEPLLTNNNRVGQDFALQVHPTGIDYLSQQSLTFAPDTPVFVSGGLVDPSVSTGTIFWRPVSNSSSIELLDDVRIDRRQLVIEPDTKVTGGGDNHALIVSALMRGGDLVVDEAEINTDLTLNRSANGTARRSTFQQSTITIDSNSLFTFETQANQNRLLETSVRATGDTAATINLREQWWGTTDPAVVEDMIFHENDGPGRPQVDYLPISACSAQVPAGNIATLPIAAGERVCLTDTTQPYVFTDDITIPADASLSAGPNVQVHNDGTPRTLTVADGGEFNVQSSFVDLNIDWQSGSGGTLQSMTFGDVTNTIFPNASPKFSNVVFNRSELPIVAPPDYYTVDRLIGNNFAPSSTLGVSGDSTSGQAFLQPYTDVIGYSLLGNVVVSSGAELRLGPNMRIFGDASAIVPSEINVESGGSLISADNLFDNVIVRFSDSANGATNGTVESSEFLETSQLLLPSQGANIIVEQNLFRTGSEPGVSIGTTNDPSNVTFRDNTLIGSTPLRTNPTSVPLLQNNNNFAPAATIVVAEGLVTFDTTWQPPGDASLHVEGTVEVVADARLTIPPDVQVSSAEGVTLQIGYETQAGRLDVDFATIDIDLNQAANGLIDIRDSEIRGNVTLAHSTRPTILARNNFVPGQTENSRSAQIDCTAIDVEPDTLVFDRNVFHDTAPVIGTPICIAELTHPTRDNSFVPDTILQLAGLQRESASLGPFPNTTYALGGDLTIIQSQLVLDPGSVINGNENGPQLRIGNDFVGGGFEAIESQLHAPLAVSNFSTVTLHGNSLSGDMELHSNAALNISDNSILGTVTSTPLGNSSDVISLENNFWGTTDPAVIESRITHRNDNPDLPLIDFIPFLSLPPGEIDIAATIVGVSGDDKSPGSTFGFGYQIENLGVTPVDPSIVSFYLSADGTLDDAVLLDELPVPLLGSNEILGPTGTNVTLPNYDHPFWGDRLPGQFHLIAVADGDDRHAEFNEDNNIHVYSPPLDIADATLRYDAPFGSTLRLTVEGPFLRIYHDGFRVASRPVDTIEGVILNGAPGEFDDVTINYFPTPLPTIPNGIEVNGELGDKLNIHGIADSTLADIEAGGDLSGQTVITAAVLDQQNLITATGFTDFEFREVVDIDFHGHVNFGDHRFVVRQEFGPVQSSSVRLADLTEIGGGLIQLTNDDATVVLDGGSTLTGIGNIDGAFAAGAGSTIVLLGQLELGAPLPNGFFSDGQTIIGGQRLVLNDSNQAVLGSLTRIGDQLAMLPGELIAPNGFLLENGKDLIGFGDVRSPQPGALFENEGVVNGIGPGPLVFHDPVIGNGRFDGNVVTVQSLSPGKNSTSLIEAGDSLTFASTNTLHMDLGGTGTGEFDRLEVSGTLSIDGTLAVKLVNNYQPEVGDEFEIVSSSNIQGDFVSFSGLDLGNNLRLEPVVSTNSYLLRVVSDAPPGQIVNRQIFYNGSAFDGNDSAANAADDDAIATDKQPLFAGQTATFANYSTFHGGITGVAIDIVDLPDSAAIDPSDLILHVGNDNTPSSWTRVPPVPQVLVREGAGVGGSDRVTLTWDHGAISNVWLEVQIPAQNDFGLLTPDRFYFGNAVGDTGNSATDTSVDGSDFIGVRGNPGNFRNPALIDNLFDINRDRFVDAIDLLIVRDHATGLGHQLHLITIPPALTKQLIIEEPKQVSSYDPIENASYSEEISSDAHAPLVDAIMLEYAKGEGDSSAEVRLTDSDELEPLEINPLVAEPSAYYAARRSSDEVDRTS